MHVVVVINNVSPQPAEGVVFYSRIPPNLALPEPPTPLSPGDRCQLDGELIRCAVGQIAANTSGTRARFTLVAATPGPSGLEATDYWVTQVGSDTPTYGQTAIELVVVARQATRLTVTPTRPVLAANGAESVTVTATILDHEDAPFTLPMTATFSLTPTDRAWITPTLVATEQGVVQALVTGGSVAGPVTVTVTLSNGLQTATTLLVGRPATLNRFTHLYRTPDKAGSDDVASMIVFQLKRAAPVLRLDVTHPDPNSPAEFIAVDLWLPRAALKEGEISEIYWLAHPAATAELPPPAQIEGTGDGTRLQSGAMGVDAIVLQAPPEGDYILVRLVGWIPLDAADYLKTQGE